MLIFIKMEFVELGERLGLKETELREFVDKKELEKFERDERAADREARKIEREIELERIKRETELHRIKNAELAVENAVQNSKPRAKLPKLPVFEENKDCIDSYLQRFERFATNAGWTDTIWAIHLSALLKGKALEVYSRLPVSEASSYKDLKLALLKRFQLTEEGFHSKFRSSKPEQGETPSQFFARIDNYIEKWLNLAKSPRTYDGLKDLFLREQFMNSCAKYLAIFLKERHPQTVADMANLADQFIEAHGYSSFYKMFKISRNLVLRKRSKFRITRVRVHHGNKNPIQNGRTKGVTSVTRRDIWQKTVMQSRSYQTKEDSRLIKAQRWRVRDNVSQVALTLIPVLFRIKLRETQ